MSLLVLALLAVTLQSFVASGASFVAAETGASRSFIAGSVSHTNSHAGSFIIDVASLRPGGSVTQTVTITGGPDVPATYTVSRLALSDDPIAPALSSVLCLQVQDVTGAAQTLYNGTVADFTVANLGVIGDGETRQLRFTLTYPVAGAAWQLQGASTVIELEFVGVSL